MVPHMLMHSMPVREALGLATSTHEKEVEVPPHMTEDSVGVLINNSAVGAKGHLPSPSLNVPTIASPGTHVSEGSSTGTPCRTDLEIRRHYSHQPWRPWAHKGRQSCW